MTDNSLAARIANTPELVLTDSKTLYHSSEALPLLQINTTRCQAIIALQGAQLLSFQPRGENDWLWLSPYAKFSAGKAIRGGIPVCLPWFGVNRTNPDKPKHGFVRNSDWQLVDVARHGEALSLMFDFIYTGDKPDLFTTAFSARLCMVFSHELSMTLKITNNSNAPAEFSWALHSYLAVASLTQTRVTGLHGLSYLDNTQSLASVTQHGDLTFTQEVDRVFNTTTQAQTVSEQTVASQHSLTIDGTNCKTCIVWNPGETLAMTLDDIKDGYKNFICVERGCAFDDTITLAANASFSSTMTISKTLP